jgi:hypothetical protein
MQTFNVDPHRLEEILNYCLNFAKMMISKHGEFYPFGAVLDAKGKLNAHGSWTGAENPPGTDVYRLLQDSMRTQFRDGKIVAAGIAANVNIPPQYHASHADGIRIHLECSGYSRFIYLPYQITQDSVAYGELFSVEAPHNVCI